MIKRKAILIGCTGAYRSLRPLDWVELDLENYRHFLQSNIGGEWQPEEIITLENPKASDVIEAIKQPSIDYTFTAFSGYGSIKTYSQSDIVFLSDTDLSIGELVTPSPRQTILFDVANEFSTITRPAISEDSKKAYSDYPKKSTRKIFDEAISKTPEGIILVFSCLPGQTPSVNSSLGGLFSLSMIQSGRSWGSNQPATKVLSINEAVEEVKRTLREIYLSSQTPEMAGQIRRLDFPPFAVGTL